MITIVGEAPSRTSDPKRPFAGSSGDRLAKLAGFSCRDELASRALLVNVLKKWPGEGHAGEKGSRFPLAAARKAARRFERLEGVVILAGRRVARAMGHERAEYFRFRRARSAWVVVIPHPSGCCRFWNFPENRETASKFLRNLFEKER